MKEWQKSDDGVQERSGSIPVSGSNFPGKFEEVRTKSEQIIILPPYSVHARARGNCEIRFRVGSEQRSISAGTKNQREANARADAILARWLVAQGQTTAGKKTGLQAEIAAFLEAEYADVKPATRTEAELVMRRFTATFDVTHAQDITREVFRGEAKRYRGTASPKYWSNILAITRRFSGILVDQGKILQDFTKDVPMPPKSSFGRRETTWTDEEFEEALGYLEPFDKDVLMVMRWTGMDSSDIAEFRKRHITKDGEGNWTIKKRREKAKTDDETILQPISSRVRSIFLARHKAAKGPEDRLFGDRYATPRSFTTSLLGRVRRAAGATKDLKSLRHTFATYHAERGVPLDVLRGWMGHARDSRVLDRIYLHRASTAGHMD